MSGPINLSFPCKDGVGVLTIGHELAARIVTLAYGVERIDTEAKLRRDLSDSLAAREELGRVVEELRASISTLQDANDRIMKERNDALAKLAITQSDRAEQQRVAMESEREAQQARAKLSLALKDIADAAGELMVPLPEPGTLTAKLLAANSILRRERDMARLDRNDALRDAEAVKAERNGIHVRVLRALNCTIAQGVATYVLPRTDRQAEAP